MAKTAVKSTFPAGKCREFAGIRFTFPDRTDEKCRQNGHRSDCPISSQGKVPLIRGNLVHFPPIGRTRNAGKMATEAIVLFRPPGKCHRFAEIWFTFPDRKCRQKGRRSDCLISSQGKVPRIRGKTVHFPLIERTRNAGKMATEAIVLFRPPGKCH